MTNMKEQSSLVATQHAGQTLDADFCRWHARLVDDGLVASCTLENCPLQHTQAAHGSVKNPAHIVLRPGVTLADLKQAFGKDDWPLFKDSLPDLRSALNQLDVSKHPAGVLSERGASSHHGLLPHERDPVGPLVGHSKFLIDNLAPSLVWIVPTEQQAKEGLNNILSNVGPGSLKQGELLCEFLHSHFEGFNLFAEQWRIIPKKVPSLPFLEPDIPEEVSSSPWLPSTHSNGLKLLDASLTQLNRLAQLVRYEPLHLDLLQRRLLQKMLLEGNVPSAADWLQVTLGVRDSTAVDLMLNSFLEALTPLGLTQKPESMDQIYALLSAAPSLEPIEALVKMQRRLLSQIAFRLNDPAYFVSEKFDRDQLLVRYKKVLNKCEKVLNNWCACRDGVAAGPRRALTS